MERLTWIRFGYLGQGFGVALSPYKPGHAHCAAP